MHGSSTVKNPREKSPKDLGIELMNPGWTTLIDFLNLISKSFFRPKDIRKIPTILARKFAKFGRYKVKFCPKYPSKAPIKLYEKMRPRL